jgi:hypothetical protein
MKLCFALATFVVAATAFQPAAFLQQRYVLYCTVSSVGCSVVAASDEHELLM